MSPYTAYACAWFATAIAVSIAVYLTGSGVPLFTFILPLLISVNKKDDK